MTCTQTSSDCKRPRRNFEMVSFSSYSKNHLTKSTWPGVRVSDPGSLRKVGSEKFFWRRVWSSSFIILLNLPTAFWGLLGPRKDVMVDFIKTVSKQTAISLAWPEIALGSQKTPKSKMCYFFSEAIGRLICFFQFKYMQPNVHGGKYTLKYWW